MIALEIEVQRLMNAANANLKAIGFVVDPITQYAVLMLQLKELGDRDDSAALLTGVALLIAMDRLRPHLATT